MPFGGGGGGGGTSGDEASCSSGSLFALLQLVMQLIHLQLVQPFANAVIIATHAWAGAGLA